jgi:phage FluMu protein Com
VALGFAAIDRTDFSFNLVLRLRFFIAAKHPKCKLMKVSTPKPERAISIKRNNNFRQSVFDYDNGMTNPALNR